MTSRQIARPLNQSVTTPLWAVLLAGALVVGLTAWLTYQFGQDDTARTELVTITGTVDGVANENSVVCVELGNEPPGEGGECYEAVNVLNPVPAIGQRVRLVYVEAPVSPGSPISTARIVAIEILAE